MIDKNHITHAILKMIAGILIIMASYYLITPIKFEIIEPSGRNMITKHDYQKLLFLVDKHVNMQHEIDSLIIKIKVDSIINNMNTTHK